MKPFSTITSRIVALPFDDIDTDQIIPARFLKTTVRVGLGNHLFADWRQDPDFVLNQPRVVGAQMLLAGNNFGCGSSREHAPWALLDWGFRVIVARSFGDIFRNNALQCGLLPVVVTAAQWAWLLDQQEDPAFELTVDLRTRLMRCADSSEHGETFPARFEIAPFARECLLAGRDQLSYLLSFSDRIRDYEARRSS